jgi:hypothetical protein
MAQTYRAQVTVWHDSLAPADGCTINPAFHVTSVWPAGPSGLADDLASAVYAKFGGSTNRVRVRMYELPLVKPIVPVAEVFKGSTSPASSCNREVALCLSYYSGSNTKRHRGRLYIPAHWLAISSLPSRPTSQNQTDALGWRTIFTGLGGVDVDWVLWSERDQAHRPVTDCYVDNEWDVVRSRGLKPTLRSTATTTEGSEPNFLALQAPQPPLPAAA